MKDGLQVWVAELDQLGIVANSGIWVDSPVLEPLHALLLILLQQNGGSWLDAQCFELVVLADGHWVALEDPAIYFAVRLRKPFLNEIVNKVVWE